MPDKIDYTEALAKLREFYRQQHRPPSYSEIAKLFNYRSKNAAFELIQKLVQQGLLKKDKSGKVLFDSLNGIKLLGTVRAGFPSATEEQLLDVLSLDEYLIQHPAQSFLIKVTGDSMVDAGIHEGDLVVIEKNRQAKDQDIVIAQVDGEWTLKYYEKRANKVRLIAANKKYAPIVPENELLVGGVVTAVIRKYS